MTLVTSANRALAFGLEKESLPALAETAVALGKIQGLDPAQAFNDIVVGIARASPLILDNLGIILDAEKTYREYAESIGVAADQLTKSDKLLALQIQTIKNSRIVVLKNAVAVRSLKDEITSFSTTVKNTFREAFDTLGDAYAEINFQATRQIDLQKKAIELSSTDHPSALSVLRKKIILTNEQQIIFNKLLEKTINDEKSFSDAADELNRFLNVQDKSLKQAGLALKDYKGQLEGARTALQKLLEEQTQEQAEANEDLIKTQRDQLVLQRALKKAGIEPGQTGLNPIELQRVTKALEDQNKEFGSAVRFSETLSNDLTKRITLLQEEQRLRGFQSQIFQLENEEKIVKSITGKEIDRSDNFEDFQNRFNKYVDEDIPGLETKIEDVNNQIESLNENTTAVVATFASIAQNLQLSSIFAGRLQRIINSLAGATVDVDVNVDLPNNELLDTGN